MRAIASLAAAIVLAAVSPAAAACDGTPLASSRPTITVDGMPRTFIVRAPAAADGRTPAPLVFAFHPFGMNGDYMASRVPVARVWPEAVVIYPTGAPQPGAGGGPSWQTAPGALGDRDLHFFDAMLAWAQQHGCVDSKRVFAFGYSNGAGFAYLLACERGDVLAGLAIASGSLRCQPARPMPVIINHGLRDSTIPPYNAGTAAATWSTTNRCSAAPTGGRPGCSAATACASAPVTMCSYDGGHEYDSSFTATAVEFLKK
jgi:polyhydroxybutyrate depolymerase